MKKCTYCGTNIEMDAAGFCPVCGAALGVNSQNQSANIPPQGATNPYSSGGAGANPFGPQYGQNLSGGGGTNPFGPQYGQNPSGAGTNPYGQYGQYLPPYAPFPAKPKQKEKGILYLFIISLIFLIFFAIRTISNFISVAGWSSFPEVQTAVWITSVVSLLTTCVLIALLIVITKAKNTQKPIAERIGLSKAIVGLAVGALVCGIVYFIAEISLCVTMGSLYDISNIFLEEMEDIGSYVSDSVAVTSYIATIIGSVIFCLSNIITSIIGVVKAKAFAACLKDKQQTTAGD